MLFCLTPHLQTYPAWLDLPGVQGSRRYSSEYHKGTQASTTRHSIKWSAATHMFGTKENVYTRKEFNSHRIGLVHQRGGRRIVLSNTAMAAVASCENTLLVDDTLVYTQIVIA